MFLVIKKIKNFARRISNEKKLNDASKTVGISGTMPKPIDIGICSCIQVADAGTLSNVDKKMDAMLNIGVCFFRTDIKWRLVEPQKGQFQFNNYDKVINYAVEKGGKLLAQFNQPPEWATPLGEHLDEWRMFVDTVVRRYPQIRYWEMFNEPNLSHFWGSETDAAGYGILGPDLSPRPAYYALKTLREAYPAQSVINKEKFRKEPAYRMCWTAPASKKVWAVWYPVYKETLNCTIKVQGNIEKSFDGVGEPVDIALNQGQFDTVLGARVLYLVGPDSVEIVAK